MGEKEEREKEEERERYFNLINLLEQTQIM
jgi:hypothetical protein